MPSRATLFFRRLVPESLARPWRQLKGRLFLSRRAIWWAERERFFHAAFAALSYNGIGGDYAEFGCHGGRTFSYAYYAARRWKHAARLWGFDSFRGLPPPKEKADEHRQWQEGRLGTSVEQFHGICWSNRIPRDRYDVVEGFYEESLPGAEEPRDICLAYVDCDMYSSTKTVLEWLGPRLKHGMILAFDDYFCWSDTQPAGERKAAEEYFADNEAWRLAPYIQFGWNGMSYTVEAR